MQQTTCQPFPFASQSRTFEASSKFMANQSLLDRSPVVVLWNRSVLVAAISRGFVGTARAVAQTAASVVIMIMSLMFSTSLGLA